ncbi:uncharacterized protein LOC123873304 [Maniola jurtina]|uniref:uncharacterized protein LOC123873304 n=1 Tax=Maniola jurtina TaxID=191418 RepID=UPI001E68A50B|nr:uncharacterized protein LOC123873304 [Maniola jurtina]
MADSQQKAEAKSIEVGKPTRTLERKDKFVFNQCCFCVPLRTGCLILAYLFLVGSIAIGIYSTLVVVSMVANMSRVPADFRHVLISILGLNSVTLVLVLISIPFNILLLVGLHKERRNFVKRYLIFQLVYIILSVILDIVRMSMGRAYLVSYIIILVNLVFNIYYLLVLRSQYVKMGETAYDLPGRRYRDGHVVDTS